MRSLFLVCWMLMVTNVFASNNGSQPLAGGTLKGVIIDAQSKSPVEYANVVLYKYPENKLISGTITDATGKFEITGLPAGRYKLQYTFIGYDAVENDSVMIGNKGAALNLGTLSLRSSVKQLDEVVVAGEKALYQNSIDRKVFNVDKNILSQSGTATDILQTVPSVSVDIDGNVSLRGSENVTILINGRPSILTGDNSAAILQQMPANTIDRIEVITNPSAKYDPEGTSGIINIILKENAKLGMNGTATANIGTRGKYNASVSINYNPGKLNYYTTYSFRRDKSFDLSESYRMSVFNDTANYLDLWGDENNTRMSHVLRAGIDYNINKTNQTGFSLSTNIRESEGDDLVDYLQRDYSKIVLDSFFRKSNELEDFFNYDVSAYYQKKFNDKGHEWKIDGNFSTAFDNETNTYDEESYLYTSNLPTLQNNKDYSIRRNLNFQGDYTNPFSEKSKFEAGFKVNYRSNDNDLKSETLNNLDAIWYNDTNITNRFVYEEQIYSVYATYSTTIGKFSFMPGLSAEKAYRNSELKTTGQQFNKEYFSLFPTLHMVQKLNDRNEISLSYSRRINRPRGQMLNPFADYSDPRTLRIGNPDLNPEYINSVEFSYTFTKGRNSIQPSIFYRQTIDGFARYNEAKSDSSNLITFENLNKSESSGVEIVYIWQLFKWWNVNISGSGFWQAIDATNLDPEYSKSSLNWNAKFISTHPLPEKISLQIMGFYRSPFSTPQGKSLPMYSVTVGVKKDVLKGKGTITLNASDVFNTQQFGMKLNTSEMDFSMLRKRESQIVYLGFTYRFGNAKKSDKNKRNEQNGEQQDSMMEMF